MPMRHVCMWKERGGNIPHCHDCTLLGHDAERHVPNMAMTSSKITGELDLTYFNNVIEKLVKIMSIINEINFYIIYKRERRRPAVLHCCSCECLLDAILAN
jgi:hypothetical protein